MVVCLSTRCIQQITVLQRYTAMLQSMQQCTGVASSPSAPDSTDHASACCQEELKQQGKCAEASALRALSKLVNHEWWVGLYQVCDSFIDLCMGQLVES